MEMGREERDLHLDLYIAGDIFGHFCNGAGKAQCSKTCT